MSSQRDKGTRYETYLLGILSKVWPTIDRAALKGGNDRGDFINTGGWLVEAKKWDTWALPEWIRTVQKKVRKNMSPMPWVIVFASDKRAGLGDLVVQPLEQWVAQWERIKHMEWQVDKLQDTIRKTALK